MDKRCSIAFNGTVYRRHSKVVREVCHILYYDVIGLPETQRDGRISFRVAGDKDCNHLQTEELRDEWPARRRNGLKGNHRVKRDKTGGGLHRGGTTVINVGVVEWRIQLQGK